MGTNAKKQNKKQPSLILLTSFVLKLRPCMPCLQKARTLSWRQTAEKQTGTSCTAAALSASAGSPFVHPSRSFGCLVSVWMQQRFLYVPHNILVVNCLVGVNQSQPCVVPTLYLWLLSGSWTWALLTTSCWTSTSPEGSRSLYTLQRKTKTVMSRKKVIYISLDFGYTTSQVWTHSMNLMSCYSYSRNYWNCSFSLKASKVHMKSMELRRNQKTSQTTQISYFEIAIIHKKSIFGGFKWFEFASLLHLCCHHYQWVYI